MTTATVSYVRDMEIVPDSIRPALVESAYETWALIGIVISILGLVALWQVTRRMYRERQFDPMVITYLGIWLAWTGSGPMLRGWWSWAREVYRGCLAERGADGCLGFTDWMWNHDFVLFSSAMIIGGAVCHVFSYTYDRWGWWPFKTAGAGVVVAWTLLFVNAL